MQIRSPFNYDKDQASLATALICEDPSRTQQHFRDECDINWIVERFGINVPMPVDGRIPTYGDFSEVKDYHTALQAVRTAAEAFMQVPSKVRERFNHDPQAFVEFCSNPNNRKELAELGLTRTTGPVRQADPAAGAQQTPSEKPPGVN